MYLYQLLAKVDRFITGIMINHQIVQKCCLRFGQLFIAGCRRQHRVGCRLAAANFEASSRHNRHYICASVDNVFIAYIF